MQQNIFKFIGISIILFLAFDLIKNNQGFEFSREKIIVFSCLLALLVIMIDYKNLDMFYPARYRKKLKRDFMEFENDYPLNKHDDDYIMSGLKYDQDLPNQMQIQDFDKNLFPYEDINSTVTKQQLEAGIPVSSESQPYMLKNMDMYTKDGLDFDEISSVIELNEKLSKYRKYYDQHNHVQWTPHTHLGKYMLKENIKKL